MNNNTLDITEQDSVFGTLQSQITQTLDPIYHDQTQQYKGIPSGFSDLDKVLNGFQKGELTTIAVRPGIGKTSFLLSLLNNIAINDSRTVSLFSLERTTNKIVKRLVESATGVAITKINDGKIDDMQRSHVKAILKNMNNANVHIEDNPHNLLEDIIEKSTVLAEKGTEIILVDYLELIGTNIQNPQCNDAELCIIMRELQKAAKELNVAIVVFSQLSKPVIYNNPFKYTPDEVNENTDTLMFINRPDYYHINQIEQKEKGIAEITVVKGHEISEAKVVNLRFIEALDRFENLN
jgi:replicative DNA helicase